eukprot:6179222-Prymnesium_polylepis.1
MVEVGRAEAVWGTVARLGHPVAALEEVESSEKVAARAVVGLDREAKGTAGEATVPVTVVVTRAE